MTRGKKLRERLERSRGVCRRRDIVRYYTIHGFEYREGGSHTVFHHPRHPKIMGIVASHRMLDVAYARAALRAAKKLRERRSRGETQCNERS